MADAVTTEFLLFDSRVSQAMDLYTSNVVESYTQAFDEANFGFSKTIEEHNAQIRAPLELSLTALSLIGGAVLVRVFADAAIKSVAKTLLLGDLCEMHLKGVFKAAKLVEANPTASFIAGELWDVLEGVVGQGLKDQFDASLPNLPSFTRVQQSPLSARSYLAQFIIDCKTKAYELADIIRTSTRLSDESKIQSIKRLQGSSYITSAPRERANTTELSIEIELTWWMHYLLSKQVTRVAYYGGVPCYGAPGGFSDTTTPGSFSSQTQYRLPLGDELLWGNTVQARMNLLHRQRFSEPFLMPWSFRGRDVEQAVFFRAQDVLTALANESAMNFR